MRLFGYIVAGWLAISFFSSAIFMVGGGIGDANLLFPVLVIAVVFWLRRHYRKGDYRGDEAPTAIRRLDAAVERRLAQLAEDLPPDPLQSDEVVNAWALHGRDGAALERLRTTYEEIRDRHVEARYELSRLRSVTDGQSWTSTVDGYQRLDAEVEHLRDYVGAVRLLADEAPELVDRAIAEHARAEQAVRNARHTVIDPRSADALELADEKLQGARAALAKGAERPLDALRLATEARRLAERTRPATQV